MSEGTTYHYDTFRTGLQTEFEGPSSPAALLWGKYLAVNCLGPVRAAPVFLESWLPPGRDTSTTGIFVATCRNEVLAFAEDDLFLGKTQPVWRTKLARPSQRGGSNIPPPIGVAGTPVLETQLGQLFVLAFTENPAGEGLYIIHALDIHTGKIVHQADLHDSGAPGRPTFNGDTLDQRTALCLVKPDSGGWRIYATFAAFQSLDRGDFHGWVVAINPFNLSDQLYFPITSTIRGGGVWGPGGAASAADGSVYVATGNGKETTDDDDFFEDYFEDHPRPPDIGDFFEAVVRLGVSPVTGQLEVIGWYMPTDAQQLNDDDMDLGGSSPLVLPHVNGQSLEVVTGKSGEVWLLPELKGGHWGGELDRQKIFDGVPGGDSTKAKGAPATLVSPTGERLVYVSGAGMPGLVALVVEHTGGAGFKFKVRWKVTGDGLPFGQWAGSPIVTKEKDGGRALVWIVDDGNVTGDGTLPDRAGLINRPTLQAFDALTGAEVYNSTWRPEDALDPFPRPTSMHFPPMTCTSRSVLIGTTDGFACYGRLPASVLRTRRPALSMVALHVDHPGSGNHAYYRLHRLERCGGRDLDPSGVDWAAWGPPRDYRPIQVPGWFGNRTQGAGASIVDVDRDGRPDLIVFHIDDGPTDRDRGFYRIGRNLGAGGATGGWFPSEPIKVPGWFGTQIQGGGIAAPTFMSDADPSLIVFHVDKGSSDHDKGFYRIGRHLKPDGTVSSWIPADPAPPIKAPGWYGLTTQTAAIAAAAIRPAEIDLVVFHVDDKTTDPVDHDKGFYRIGWNIDPNTGVALGGWTGPIMVPGWFGRQVQGAGIALVDLDGDGALELIIFHVDEGGSDHNKGYYRIGWHLDPPTGQIKNGWSWFAAPDSEDRLDNQGAQPPLSDYNIPGWFGLAVQHAGLAVAELLP